MRFRNLCLLLLLTAGCDEWDQFYGGGANSGFRAVRTEFARASERWSVQVGNVFTSSPVTGPDGTLYVGNTDGELVAVSADGVELWRFAIPNARFVTTPAVAPDGHVFVITGHRRNDGTGMSLLLEFTPDGSLLTFAPFPDTGFTTASPKIVPTAQGYQIVTYVPIHPQEAPPELVIFDDRLDVVKRQALPVCRGEEDSWWDDVWGGLGDFFSVFWDALDGTDFDHAPLPTDVELLFWSLHPTPAVTPMDDEGRVGLFVASACHVAAFAWQSPTLTQVWEDEITRKPMPLSSPALMLDGTLALSGGAPGSDHGHVYAWDPATGLRLWEHATDNPTIATPSSNGRFVYVATRDELVVLEGGALVATRPYGEGTRTAASVALSASGGFLSADGLFLSFDFDLGDELAIEGHKGAGLASPAIGEDGTVYAIAEDRLIAFETGGEK